ncbi:unnamed protein product [Coregonus sp. 'balchen']|nr:unnamed protein product [Coregonus sp. 'balchen']
MSLSPHHCSAASLRRSELVGGFIPRQPGEGIAGGESESTGTHNGYCIRLETGDRIAIIPEMSLGVQLNLN